MKKKAILFIDKIVDSNGFRVLQLIKDDGYITTIADGNFKKGFQDSCQAVYLNGDFPHVKEWAESSGIDILSFDKEAGKPKIIESEEEKEPKKTESEKIEPEKVELEKPTARRGRKPKSETIEKTEGE